jgi:hypothetical protein
MSDWSRQYSENGDPVSLENTKNIFSRTAGHILSQAEQKGEDFSYDDYFETLILNYPPELLDYYLATLTADPTKEEILQLIELKNQMPQKYQTLFADPGIALRAQEFILFAQKLPLDPQVSLLLLRRQFIDSCETKTYYRGLLLRTDDHTIVPSTLSAVFRGEPRKELFAYEQRLRVMNNLKSVAGALPFFSAPFQEGTFFQTVLDHQRRGIVTSPLLSVSEFPQVSWHAIANQYNELSWKAWDRGMSIIIYKFEMNSFYAIPITRVFSKPDFVGTKALRIGNIDLPAGDSRLEQLVPIALPCNFIQNPRIFRPSFVPFVKQPFRFQIPKSQDWE